MRACRAFMDMSHGGCRSWEHSRGSGIRTGNSISTIRSCDEPRADLEPCGKWDSNKEEAIRLEISGSHTKTLWCMIVIGDKNLSTWSCRDCFRPCTFQILSMHAAFLSSPPCYKKQSGNPLFFCPYAPKTFIRSQIIVTYIQRSESCIRAAKRCIPTNGRFLAIKSCRVNLSRILESLHNTISIIRFQRAATLKVYWEAEAA